MLQIERFDIKTGKPIQESIEGSRQPVTKHVENSYLEHWLAANNIKAQFSVAKFYPSVNDLDRQRLESEDRVLVFSSGSDGYFTDSKTAELMTLGSDSVNSIYAANQNSPHNDVAYGSLISSDGVASTALSPARILVIDDEARSHGDETLLLNNKPISEQQLSALYDKMGDGTMLVSQETMQALQTAEEREKIALSASEKSGVDGDFSTLFQDMTKADAAVSIAERQEQALARRSVYQFRAASPNLPGIAKGTAASSQWCERLGVAAIISTNDIKGDDGRFSKPGIQEVSNLWMNRKSTAEYGQQSVGPQVKNTIPEATVAEINPAVKAQTGELAQAAGDFVALSQRYIEQHEREQSSPYQSLEDLENTQDRRTDGLYEVLKADKYGQLAGQSNAVRGLNRFVQNEWKRLALNGTSVPSAMAQHHSQLKPWEVCNKNLPHGSIVAYYRSPFPNVGAAAIAINNTEVIQTQDREAFSKSGVAYLPPWTAKNIAITDFDGDANGFFVGYQATVDDLPQQVRSELASVAALPEAQQYEAGRDLFDQMIQQLDQGQEDRIVPAESPLAVKEFVEKNAPGVRPPEIVKQKKEKHAWSEGESHSAATWRAWEITAENPTGKVANAGMSLQALASELRYAPEENQEAMLKQVSNHFSKVLRQADAGEVSIPDDDWLTSQGFSPFYGEKIEEIAIAYREANKEEGIEQRKEFIEISLRGASNFLSEVANGPNAVNLQTAVDTAKSSRGIDEGLHRFVMALQYKQDELRKAKNDTSVYMDGNLMPTSTEEPVAWGVQIVNEQYSDVQLLERKNTEFEALLPKADSTSVEKTTEIALANNRLVKDAVENKGRVRQQRSEDQQPTLLITLPDGQRLELQNIEDKQGTLPIWRSPDDQQLAGTIRIKRDNSATSKKQFPAQLVFVDSAGKTQARRIGYVSPASAKENEALQQLPNNQKVTLDSPTVTVQVPWAQRHDTDILYEQASQYLASSLAPPDGIDPEAHHKETAAALWRDHRGRNVAIKIYPDIIADRLSPAPSAALGRLQVSADVRQQLIDQSPHTIQFGIDKFESTETIKGRKVTSIVDIPTVYVVQPDGDRLFVGAIGKRNPALPEGKTYMAHLSANKSAKVIDMQILDLPTVEQTKEQLGSLEQGRSHMTFEGEPYAVYGVREGDIVVAESPDNEKKQIAVQVGKQYRITEKTLETEGYTEKWAQREQAPAAELTTSIDQAQENGKTLWGLTVEPLGEYKAGRIHQPSGELWLGVHQSAEIEMTSGETASLLKGAGAISSPGQQPSSGKPPNASLATNPGNISAESKVLMSVADVQVAAKAAKYVENHSVSGELDKLLSEQPGQPNIAMTEGFAQQVEQTRSLARQKVQQSLAAQITPLAKQLMQNAKTAGLVEQQGNETVFKGKQYVVKAIRQEGSERVEVSCRKGKGFVHSVDGKVTEMQGLQIKDKDVFKRLAGQTPTQLRRMVQGKKKEAGVGV